MSQLRYGLAMLAALAKRPLLIPTAFRQIKQMSRPRWWASRPFLPLPPADYVEFRQVTATGDGSAMPEVHDTIVWLEWCRSLAKLPRS